MKILRIPLVIALIVVAGREFNANAQMETNLYNFAGYPNDGAYPYGGLVPESDGNFYGTTASGGTNDEGTVFRISPGGSETNLYSFDGPPNNGYEPGAGLAQGGDGNYYGTTYYGGTSTNCGGGCGTVFQISPSGTETNLHSFAGPPSDGYEPYAGLVQSSDGNFYGTTYYGGTSTNCNGGCGIVFRISPSGSYTNLHSFSGYPRDGANPRDGLVQGSDGNFYGTATVGGSNNYGTIFRISPSGSYTNLHSFAGFPNDGYYPIGGLVQGSDGNLFGTTGFGGTHNEGTVFQVSPSGSETNLYSFSGSPKDGYGPEARLVQGSDGNFYGTTAYGGANTNCNAGCGTVFRVSPRGSETNLYSFGNSPTDGVEPLGGLVQGSDGNLYGTASGGGTFSNGTVFKLTVPLSPPANQISGIQFFSVFDSTGVAILIPSVAGETYQLQSSDSMSPTNWLNTGGTITSIGGPLILPDFPDSLPPQRFYRAVITP